MGQIDPDFLLPSLVLKNKINQATIIFRNTTNENEIEQIVGCVVEEK